MGWIKLHRKLLDSSIFSSEKGLKVWIWCLLKVSHTENDVFLGAQKVHLQKGQFVFGRDSASEDLQMSPSTVRNWIKILQQDSYLDIKPTNKYSIVTVLKWKDYQEIDIKKDNRITTEKQQNNTYNKEKNVENDKNNTALVEKIVSWAYERARGTPSCNKDAFRRSVLFAINKYGEIKVEKAFELEENAITFLQNIKNL